MTTVFIKRGEYPGLHVRVICGESASGKRERAIEFCLANGWLTVDQVNQMRVNATSLRDRTYQVTFEYRPLEGS